MAGFAGFPAGNSQADIVAVTAATLHGQLDKLPGGVLLQGVSAQAVGAVSYTHLRAHET